MAHSVNDPRELTYRLWRLAMAGDIAGATNGLEKMDRDELPVLAVDLLARLYVRKGRLVEAGELWEQILRIDPAYAPALLALDKLRSPWMLQAIAKAYTKLFVKLVIGIFAVYGATALFVSDDLPAWGLVCASISLAILATYLAELCAWVFLTAESLLWGRLRNGEGT